MPSITVFDILNSERVESINETTDPGSELPDPGPGMRLRPGSGCAVIRSSFSQARFAVSNCHFVQRRPRHGEPWYLALLERAPRVLDLPVLRLPGVSIYSQGALKISCKQLKTKVTPRKPRFPTTSPLVTY